MKYAFVDAHRQRYRVLRMCLALQVSRSGYYAWRSRKPSKRAQENQFLAEQIKVQHRLTMRAYGALKMCAHLNELGFHCGKHRVDRLRRQYGIETRRQARFRAKYAACHRVPPAPRLLHSPFHAEAANEIWVGDISLIPTRQGWLYLAILLDLFSRHIVGLGHEGQAQYRSGTGYSEHGSGSASTATGTDPSHGSRRSIQ